MITFCKQGGSFSDLHLLKGIYHQGPHCTGKTEAAQKSLSEGIFKFSQNTEKLDMSAKSVLNSKVKPKGIEINYLKPYGNNQ